MSAAITIEGLGKSYVIRHQQTQPYVALRDVLTDGAKRLGRSLLGAREVEQVHSSKEVFWALRDINLEIRTGDRVGIIGRNGAGKSTLLKILSRITSPTTGRVKIRGRIASLLEVGTGFHPELTGRENIFLNGAILGMPRAEIFRKFDEIVDFSEVEKFLDTPVKRYSSGMYVRLAFSVAAHLDPEILVVDEVLAVGDAAFQRKCLGKMENVTSEGRTLLFVSHNTNAIEMLCTKAVLLQKGRVVVSGENVREVIAAYGISDQRSQQSTEWTNDRKEFENPYFKPTRFAITRADGASVDGPIRNDEDAYVTVEGVIAETDIALCVGYAIYDDAGRLLYWSYQTDLEETKWPILEVGKNLLRSRLPRRWLNAGRYRLEFIASQHFRAWICAPGENVPTIYLTIEGGLSNSPYWMVTRPGILAPEIDWKISSMVSGDSKTRP